MRPALLSLCLVALVAHADVVLVDRVVAVVDTHAISRSAVELRMQPMLAQVKTDAQRAQARRDALTELIEDWLIQQEAQRFKLEVTEAEVTTALGTVAEQNAFTVEQLMLESKRQGFEGDAYRAMLKRKLLEFKWLNLKLNRAAQPTGEAERGAYLASERARLLGELKSRAVIEVRP